MREKEGVEEQEDGEERERDMIGAGEYRQTFVGREGAGGGEKGGKGERKGEGGGSDGGERQKHEGREGEKSKEGLRGGKGRQNVGRVAGGGEQK